MAMTQERIEQNLGLMILLIVVLVLVGGLVQIVPLFFMHSTTEPVEGLKPYTALQVVGRDIYIREGCYGCHSQMIRPFRAETERYGHYSLAGEFVYDHPFQWDRAASAPTWHGLAGVTRMNGTGSTCTIPVTWYRNPSCRGIPGWNATASTTWTSGPG